MSLSIKNIFKPDYEHYEGVYRINIYLLRLLYLLMFLVVGKDSWTHLLTFEGSWDPEEAVAWCVWASYSVLAVLGIVRPLKMLPLVLLEIFYKVLWLIVPASPPTTPSGSLWGWTSRWSKAGAVDDTHSP